MTLKCGTSEEPAVFRATPATARSFGPADGQVGDARRERVVRVDVNAGAVHSGRLFTARVGATGLPVPYRSGPYPSVP
jgi:hypothetical protein